MTIQINKLTTLDISQIKITGKLSVAGKEIDATLNKTLDTSILDNLPTELIEQLTATVFGADYTEEELANLGQTDNEQEN